MTIVTDNVFRALKTVLFSDGAPKKKAKILVFRRSYGEGNDTVKSGESASEVSRRFDVLRSTLIYKATGKSPTERRMGPSPALGTSAEKILLNWVVGLAQRGFPMYKLDLILSVQQICKALALTNLFNNDKPGKKWLYLFLKRHLEIAMHTVEKLSKVRAIVTEHGVRERFKEVDNYLTNCDVKSFLEDPTRVLNCDKSSFMMCSKSEKVLGIRGQKNVYEVHQGNDKDNITVLFNVSASGEIAPTMVVYLGKRLPQLSMPENWAIGRSEKGWMKGEIFFEYLVNIFYKWLKDKKVLFPVLMFLDGHSPKKLSKFCSDHDIILIALFPNATHLLQPLDVAVFKPRKQGWSKGVHEWRMSHHGQKLTKYDFAPILANIITTSMKTKSISNGFKCTGLVPFDPKQVDYSKVEVLSSVNKPKQTVIPNLRVSDAQSSLNFMESFINPTTLNEFKLTFSKFTPV